MVIKLINSNSNSQRDTFCNWLLYNSIKQRFIIYSKSQYLNNNLLDSKGYITSFLQLLKEDTRKYLISQKLIDKNMTIQDLDNYMNNPLPKIGISFRSFLLEEQKAQLDNDSEYYYHNLNIKPSDNPIVVDWNNVDLQTYLISNYTSDIITIRLYTESQYEPMLIDINTDYLIVSSYEDYTSCCNAMPQYKFYYKVFDTEK